MVRPTRATLACGNNQINSGIAKATGLSALARCRLARLRQTITGQREAIRDLRRQVTHLTLAASVLTRAQAGTQAANPRLDNVVPLRPDKN